MGAGHGNFATVSKAGGMSLIPDFLYLDGFLSLVFSELGWIRMNISKNVLLFSARLTPNSCVQALTWLLEAPLV